jgi:hypothetical protein
MLAAAICLDTQNLDTAATRCTPRDVVGWGTPSYAPPRHPNAFVTLEY